MEQVTKISHVSPGPHLSKGPLGCSRDQSYFGEVASWVDASQEFPMHDSGQGHETHTNPQAE